MMLGFCSLLMQAIKKIEKVHTKSAYKRLMHGCAFLPLDGWKIMLQED